MTPPTATPPTGEPPWLAVARRELGVHETPGPATTPRVGEYLAAAHAVPRDETAWCSAFACWCMRQVGLPIPHYDHGLGPAAARSWLTWEDSIPMVEQNGVWVPDEVPVGAVVVLWRDRPDSLHGHVGFFLRATMGQVYLLGGNQGSDTGPSYGGIVSVRGYPAARVLGLRWPSAASLAKMREAKP